METVAALQAAEVPDSLERKEKRKLLRRNFLTRHQPSFMWIILRVTSITTNIDGEINRGLISYSFSSKCFLGTELLALPTPAFQLTLYRVLALSFFLLLIALSRKDTKLQMSRNSVASFAVLTYLVWYIWAWVSGMWALDMTGDAEHLFDDHRGSQSVSHLLGPMMRAPGIN